MRKKLSMTVIAAYLMVLAGGILSHTLKFGQTNNTLSYFYVWDMFCGWRAYDERTHVIAETPDGQFFDVREPWGEFTPYGDVGRVHYDTSNQLVLRHAENILRQTAHPEVSKIYVVKEIWPKQYNMPPAVWATFRPDEYQPPQPYYHLRAVCTGDFRPVTVNPNWFSSQTLAAVGDNPRLHQAALAAQPYYSTLTSNNGHSRPPRQQLPADVTN